jgi:hypothetical protein
MVVLHKDGSKCNDVKDNLMWAPPSDNYLVKNDNSGFQRSYRAANPDIAHVVPEPVTGAEEIFTKSGMRILVDKECFGSLSKYSWSISRGGYARRGFRKDGNKTYLQMHREILGLSPDDNQVVDHINGNKLDNRRANLRICDRSENNWNVPIRSDNTSGLKGVQWHAKSQKWMAQIGFRYRTVYLGLHETAQAAHEAYCLAADMLHGEYANHGTWRES